MRLDPKTPSPDDMARATRRTLAAELAASLGQGLLAPLAWLRSGHVPRRAKDIRTVLFIHGLAGTSAGMLPLRGYLRMVGMRRQLAYGYRTVGSRRRTGSLEAMAVALRRHVDANVRGGRIDVVAHSMGGLVARAWIQLLGGHRRVDRLITLATPHRGTEMARWLPTVLGTQLRPDAELLGRLDAMPMAPGVEVVSLVAGGDTIVVPPDAARAPWGRHLVLPDVGHTSMLLSPRTFTAVHDALCAR
jgi:triacylglycerol esterase/lipase EstA (alpha/beta hydrolase family)